MRTEADPSRPVGHTLPRYRLAQPAPAGRAPPLLAIDPGLLRTGYALLEQGGAALTLREAGVIRLKRGRPLEARLLELATCLQKLVAEHRPDVLACEALFAHYRHPRTAVLMAHARGVVLAIAARHDMAVLNVSATRAKKLLTGRGHAGKVQVQRAIAATLNLSGLPEPNDVADAIAIGICGLRMVATRRATEPRP